VEWTPHGLLWTGGAWGSLFTTLTLSAVAAPITALLGLLASWVLSRQRFAGKTLLEFALMLTFCVPGTVIGVAYILTYNLPPVEITGTAIILVVCFVFRNLPVGVRSGLAAMSQLDNRWTRPRRPAGLDLSHLDACGTAADQVGGGVTALVYSFVRAMTTVSAVIFLTSAQHEMGDRVHHQPRDQWRLRDCDCVLDRADCDDDDRDRHHPACRRQNADSAVAAAGDGAAALLQTTQVTGARA